MTNSRTEPDISTLAVGQGALVEALKYAIFVMRGITTYYGEYPAIDKAVAQAEAALSSLSPTERATPAESELARAMEQHDFYVSKIAALTADLVDASIQVTALRTTLEEANVERDSLRSRIEEMEKGWWIPCEEELARTIFEAVKEAATPLDPHLAGINWDDIGKHADEGRAVIRAAARAAIALLPQAPTAQGDEP